MKKEKFDFATYNSEYKKKHYKKISAIIPLTDEKAIKKLESVPSISAYLYQLIKDDIKNDEIIERIKEES